MPKLSIQSLQPGMVVSTDVKNADGTLLVPAGCPLTEKQIGMLETWGITEVQVRTSEGPDDAVDPLAAVPAEARRRLTAELNAIFWLAPESNAVQKAVFEAALRRKARQLREARAPS